MPALHCTLSLCAHQMPGPVGRAAGLLCTLLWRAGETDSRGGACSRVTRLGRGGEGVRAGGGSECLLCAKLVLSHASQGSRRLAPSSLFYRRGNLDSERLSNSLKAEKTARVRPQAFSSCATWNPLRVRPSTVSLQCKRTWGPSVCLRVWSSSIRQNRVTGLRTLYFTFHLFCVILFYHDCCQIQRLLCQRPEIR